MVRPRPEWEAVARRQDESEAACIERLERTFPFTQRGPPVSAEEEDIQDPDVPVPIPLSAPPEAYALAYPSLHAAAAGGRQRIQAPLLGQPGAGPPAGDPSSCSAQQADGPGAAASLAGAGGRSSRRRARQGVQGGWPGFLHGWNGLLNKLSGLLLDQEHDHGPPRASPLGRTSSASSSGFIFVRVCSPVHSSHKSASVQLSSAQLNIASASGLPWYIFHWQSMVCSACACCS